MKDSLQEHSCPEVPEELVVLSRDTVVPEKSAPDSLPKVYEGSLFPKIPYEHAEINFRYSGMTVEPMPYLLRNDDGVTGTLLCCFLMMMVIFARSKKYVRQQIQDFFFNRTNGSALSMATGSEMRHTLFLHLQTGLLVALFAFDYTLSVCDMFMAPITHFQLLGIYVLCCWGFLGVRRLLYTFVNGVFFDKTQRSLWMRSYSFLISSEGVLLFPLALVTVYFDLPVKYVVLCLWILLGFVKLLLFYKTFSIFLPKIYGCVHLIVYLCALEILPACLLWKVLMLTNRVLI